MPIGVPSVSYQHGLLTSRVPAICDNDIGMTSEELLPSAMRRGSP
jgi:hypothetical protein